MSAQSQPLDEILNEPLLSEGVMTFYVDNDGKTYYSIDNGESIETLSEKEFDSNFLLLMWSGGLIRNIKNKYGDLVVNLKEMVSAVFHTKSGLTIDLYDSASADLIRKILGTFDHTE